MSLVLFVDDEPLTVEAVRTAAEATRWRHTLLTAYDGLEAVWTVAQYKNSAAGPIAVVVTDNQMPWLNGDGVIEFTRRYSPETKLILFTGEDAPSQARRPGVQAFLQKPATPAQIIVAVEALLAGSST